MHSSLIGPEAQDQTGKEEFLSMIAAWRSDQPCAHGNEMGHCEACDSESKCVHGAWWKGCKFGCGKGRGRMEDVTFPTWNRSSSKRVCLELCDDPCHKTKVATRAETTLMCALPNCPSTGRAFANSTNLIRHMHRCHPHDPTLAKKHKELDLHHSLQTAGIEFEYNKKITHWAFHRAGGPGALESPRHIYVDFMITKAWGYIIIQCDEDQHRAYDPMRDVRFDFALAQSVGSRQKLMVIRYNPDAYRIGGKTKSEGEKKRIQRLLSLLEYEPRSFERILLCYDQDEGERLPQVAVSWDAAARQVSRVA